MLKRAVPFATVFGLSLIATYVIGIVFSLVGVIQLASNGWDIGNDYRYFATMEECKNIELMKEDGAEVEVYETPEKDKKAKDLEYEQFYGCKYCSDTMTFELFAYDFSNKEDAQTYFKRHTGKDGRDVNFSSSTGMFHFELRMLNEETAYFVKGKAKDEEEILAYLRECFSVSLDEASEAYEAAQTTQLDN